ncbi:hypothetical protein [Marinifilum flexuosum]|uniref:Uncharacterized protein n=1 Tax=Marinifilum flexuosum TaxID=1117708 RepID=A0A419X9Y9_9BACT|nr:hypothetical protein [Marinifilum flexuosum]RKE04456.1 hypothetical protein BXY64_1476 [Marinifilum flexuosum]
MRKNNISVVGMELAKTVGGVMAGRYAVVMGKKVLKVDQEVDPKKKKLKEVGLGVGVAALGTVGALKVPAQYKSICAGIATAGALSAMTPFAKEDTGFIPALHGSIGAAELAEYTEDDMSDELNAVGSYQDILDMEEQDEINALEALSDGGYEGGSYELNEVN